MPEPILLSIATTLATKAAGSLFDVVKEKLAKRGKADSATLDAAVRPGAGSEEIQRLVDSLAAAERDDQVFGRRLRTEWARISVTQRVDSGGIANQIAGNVTGPVTTAVHFHDGPRAENLVPSQLPAPPPYFTGRDDQLADLDDHRATEAAQLSLVVITGQGGVGKTALALRWLHNTREGFPDGQLFVDLGGFAAVEPANPEQVLEGFLSALVGAVGGLVRTGVVVGLVHALPVGPVHTQLDAVHPVMMASYQWTYFDHPQRDHPGEPLGQPGQIVTLPDVYGFDPVDDLPVFATSNTSPTPTLRAHRNRLVNGVNGAPRLRRLPAWAGQPRAAAAGARCTGVTATASPRNCVSTTPPVESPEWREG